MSKLRFLLALWAAKLSIPALKITGHNGTDFPGILANRICPDFLRYVGKPKTVVAVTGTNGKTTITNMLTDILEAEGVSVMSNRAGANIVSGISTTFIRSCGLTGRINRYDMAVLEVDERTAPRIYPFVRPTYVVLANLFRDSIMRNAHPAYIADILTASLPKDSMMILNGDDLFSCGVAPENPRVHFAIGPMEGDVTTCVNLLNDMRLCPRCGETLHHEYLRYHHIGRSVCPRCGFCPPDAEYYAHEVDLSGRTMALREDGRTYHYPLITDSIFNVYNMLAVIALLRQLGYDHQQICRRFSDTKVPPSRQSEETVGSYTIVMQLSKEKNALAVTRNLDYLQRKSGNKEVVIMMSCLVDAKKWSENPCWLYDTDFEFLNHEDVSCIICTGPRAKDFHLRALLAGIDESKLLLVEDEFAALDHLPLHAGDSICLLYGVDSTPLAFRMKEKLKDMLLSKGGEA